MPSEGTGGQGLTVATRARSTRRQTQHVAGDRVQRCSGSHFALRVLGHALNHRAWRRRLPAVCKRTRVQLREHLRAMVGLATEHDSIAPAERLETVLYRAQAAVHRDRQLRELVPEAFHDVETQRGHRAVFAGRKTAEHRLARMHDDMAAPRLSNARDEYRQPLVVLFSEIGDRTAECQSLRPLRCAL